MPNYILAQESNRANIPDALWYAMGETDLTDIANNESLSTGDKVYVIKANKTFIFGEDANWYPYANESGGGGGSEGVPDAPSEQGKYVLSVGASDNEWTAETKEHYEVRIYDKSKDQDWDDNENDQYVVETSQAELQEIVSKINTGGVTVSMYVYDGEGISRTYPMCTLIRGLPVVSMNVLAGLYFDFDTEQSAIAPNVIGIVMVAETCQVFQVMDASGLGVTQAVYATTAGSADSASSATAAGHATTADSATTANHATTADSATNADYATTAGSATNADHATTADSATAAGRAESATSADHASTADSATTAANADYATSATTATNAVNLTSTLPVSRMFHLFGVSDTSSGATTKTTSIDGYVEIDGITIFVAFNNGNTVSAPTLNVNNTGAYPIKVGSYTDPGAAGVFAPGVHAFTLVNNNGTKYWFVNEGRDTVPESPSTYGVYQLRVSSVGVAWESTSQKGTVTLSPSAWSGSGPYTQTVTSLITASVNTKVDLQPNATVLAQMAADGTTNIFIDNNNGVLTAYALGAKPTASLTIQYTKTEVA